MKLKEASTNVISSISPILEEAEIRKQIGLRTYPGISTASLNKMVSYVMKLLGLQEEIVTYRVAHFIEEKNDSTTS